MTSTDNKLMDHEYLKLIYVLFIALVLPACDIIGDKKYTPSELNGVYVVRNYLENSNAVGPDSSDTLYLKDGTYKNDYFGQGKYRIIRQRAHAVILFKYTNVLDNKTLEGYHIDKPFFDNQRLVINSDLNYYYERINDECPDVFNK